MEPYPRRDSHFAHRFVRVLHKSCAAQDIGQSACWLLCIIAHTEDAARYKGPARFWNSQLMETLGFSSHKQLDKARNQSVAQGWLRYERDGNRSVGKYFVTIPDRFAGLSDGEIEPESDIRSLLGPLNGRNRGPKVTRIADGILPESGTESDPNSGPPSIPSPNPIPNPNPNTPATAAPDFFEDFWKAFPRGRKAKKGKARTAWSKAIKKTAPEKIIAAAVEYSASPKGSSKYVQGPEPWLNGECWEDDRAAWKQADDAPPKGITLLPEEAEDVPF